MPVPYSANSTAALEISGDINGKSIFDERDLVLENLVQTFIQADKFLYMPGQLVQFRVLTITGTKALVSYEDIPEIWIISPKGSRLAQWKKMPNPKGLLQLEFQLAEEVEEGTYQIFARIENTNWSQSFKVEEYVLPRFSLTIQPPPFVLATDSEIVFSTFSGCEEVSIATADIGYSGYAIHVRGLFVEEGTGNVMTATASVAVQYQASILEVITTEHFLKPGLPYNFRVKVTTVDSSTPKGEVVRICASSCKNYTADESGIINAYIPPHLFGGSSNTHLTVAGVYVTSDLTLETRPCHYPSFVVDDALTTTGPTLNELVTVEPDGMETVAAAPGYDLTNENVSQVELERTYFPETWLWEVVVIGAPSRPLYSESGETEQKVKLPDTVTKWVGEAVCLHPELGTGLSPKSSITSFVPFFLDLSYPATARRHEKVPVLVSVFNYLTTSLPVTVELLTSTEYASPTYSMKTCVSGSQKEVVKFLVVPLEVGDVNLTFSATIDTTGESCGGQTDIERR
ncbi:ovostatin-like [Macrobrachium rosenbergii]|uniref:ovostatin-like n=1 Tax=Macrobrachium rosenbergii TaxID=79674 RepID=UPI0034D5B6AE